MTRNILPQRRHAETFDMVFGNLGSFRVTIGFYADDVTPGEVFISHHKAATDLDAAARDGAILLSVAMQHGVPMETIRSALTRNEDGSASSLVGAVADVIAERLNVPHVPVVDRRREAIRQIVREELAQ